MERRNLEGLTASGEEAIFWKCRADHLAFELKSMANLAKALPTQTCGKTIAEQIERALERHGEFVAEFQGHDVSGYSEDV